MDGEVCLFVDKTFIGFGIDDNAQRNGLINVIVTTICTSSNSSRTVDRHATTLLTNCIAFTTIIVSACFIKFEFCDIAFVRITKTFIDWRWDGGTYGVWCVANLEGRIHHIVFGICVIYHDTRVVAFLIRKFLILVTGVLTTLRQCYTIVRLSIAATIICGRIIDRFLKGVTSRICHG